MIRTNGITIDRKGRTITHRGKVFFFNHMLGRNKRFELACYFILMGGASKEMAFWHLYADDPDGGPIDGPHIIHILLNKLATDLAEIWLSTRSWKLAGISFYEIVPRDQAVIGKRFSHGYGTKIERGGAAIGSRLPA